MKKGREYHGRGEEYNVDKGKEKAYHLPYNVKAVGKNIKWGRGKGDGNFGEENQDYKNGDGEEYQVECNFIHHCFNF